MEGGADVQTQRLMEALQREKELLRAKVAMLDSDLEVGKERLKQAQSFIADIKEQHVEELWRLKHSSVEKQPQSGNRDWTNQKSKQLERLKRENYNLGERLEIHRHMSQLYKEDFEKEKRDKEKQVEALTIEWERERSHPETFGGANRSIQILEVERNQLREHLEAKSSQTEAVIAENKLLLEELAMLDDGKNQQVMQYSKLVEGLSGQCDSYQREIAVLKRQFEDQRIAFELEAENLRNRVSNLREQFQKKLRETGRLEAQYESDRVKWEEKEREFVGTVDELNRQLQAERAREKYDPATAKGELARYRIMSYQPLEGDTFSGAGAFGSVHRVRVNNIPCIAKRILDILVGRGREEAVSDVEKHAIQEKFQKECVLLSRMRHPNIVHFMGVCYPDQNPLDLTLIMEFLPMDLEKCLKKYPNLPLPIKLSILLDVSYGLLHLHNASIIHRDLSAANVLLTHDMRAKVADLGVSKIVDIPLSTQSKMPGTVAYMPPEVFTGHPHCDAKLDVFSFGVLAMYVATQVEPEYNWDKSPEIARKNKETHIYKRRENINMMGRGHCSCIFDLVVECLQDLPEKRPKTERLNLKLKQLSQLNRNPRQLIDVVHLEEQQARMAAGRGSGAPGRLRPQSSEPGPQPPAAAGRGNPHPLPVTAV